jgi:hypothetical protein
MATVNQKLDSTIGGGEVKQQGTLQSSIQKLVSGMNGVSTMETEFGPLAAYMKPMASDITGGQLQAGSLGCTIGQMFSAAGAFAIDPIWLLGASTAEATTIAIPGTYAAGDLILMFVYRESNTRPTVPAGWTLSSGGTAGANTQSGGLYYKWAQSSSETSGTWTNAGGLVCLVYNNVAGVGNATWTNSTGTSMNYPNLPFKNLSPDAEGYSRVIAFAAHRSVNGTLSNPPAGMTNVITREGSASDLAAHDSAVGVASSPSVNGTYTGTSSGYVTAQIELIPLSVTAAADVDLYNVPVRPGRGIKLSGLGAGGSGAGGAQRNGSTRPSGYGGGAGGGGGYVQNLVLPDYVLSGTWSFIRGVQAPGVAQNQNGINGGDTLFTCNGQTVGIPGGRGGLVGMTPTGGDGGVPWTDFSAFTVEAYENGAKGGDGSTSQAAGQNGGSTTDAGAGGGGGGSNISSAYNGGVGGSVANGGNGGNSGQSGTSGPAGEGGGGGGGGAGSAGSGGTAGAGQPGGNYGGGSGGGGGKEGGSGSANGSTAAGLAYNKFELV